MRSAVIIIDEGGDGGKSEDRVVISESDPEGFDAFYEEILSGIDVEGEDLTAVVESSATGVSGCDGDFFGSRIGGDSRESDAESGLDIGSEKSGEVRAFCSGARGSIEGEGE